MLTPDQINKLSEIRDPVAKQRFAVLFQLPQNLQDSMISETTSNSIWAITKDKYKLPDYKISAVAKIIGLIFLGELPIKNFIVALRDELNVDNHTAAAIAQDINQAIFQPVRESLMKVHGLERDANIRMRANDANGYTKTNQVKPIQPSAPPQPTPIKPSDRASGSFTAKPAHYTARPNRIIDLREIKRKNRSKYNGFFTS